MIRAFIAIELSDEVKAVLSEVVETLAREVEPGLVKWVQPAQMHLTLRFLGNTPLDRLEDVTAAMDGVVAACEPFELALDALGCFPHERRPGVIWVGVRGEIARIISLQAALEEALASRGWEPEKRAFHPHLTLGRVKDRSVKVRLPWGRQVAGARTTVREMVLFKSQLSREGPRYILRHTSKLGRQD